MAITVPDMYRLANPVQNYAWGSRSVLAELLGNPAPTAEPEAELWMGAHPSAPSRLVREGAEESLAAAIESAPLALLGDATVARFGARLPFLLKLLAVDQPLSLQVHPNSDQARDGFADEEARGIRLDDQRRNYRDPNHKPELICALTPFEALCGLRPAEEIPAILTELGLGELGERNEISTIISRILQGDDPRRLVGTVLDRVRGAAPDSPFAASYRSALKLAERHPDDPGVVISLLLNVIQLQPGQAMYVPPGRLHAYLRGMGVEIMATSDNVLRGGLTAKRVDVPGLLSLLEVSCGVPEVLDGTPDGSGWCGYPTPIVDFALTRARLKDSSVTSAAQGPQILLCVDGPLAVSGQPFARGQSVFVPAGEGVDLTGTGTVFRATTGLGQLAAGAGSRVATASPRRTNRGQDVERRPHRARRCQ